MRCRRWRQYCGWLPQYCVWHVAELSPTHIIQKKTRLVYFNSIIIFLLMNYGNPEKTLWPMTCKMICYLPIVRIGWRGHVGWESIGFALYPGTSVTGWAWFTKGRQARFRWRFLPEESTLSGVPQPAESDIPQTRYLGEQDIFYCFWAAACIPGQCLIMEEIYTRNQGR